MANSTSNFTGIYQATGVSESDNGTYYMRFVEVSSTQYELWSFGVEDQDGGASKGKPNFTDDPLWSNVFHGNGSSLEQSGEFEIQFADVPLGRNRREGFFKIRIEQLDPVVLVAFSDDHKPLPGGFKRWTRKDS